MRSNSFAKNIEKCFGALQCFAVIFFLLSMSCRGVSIFVLDVLCFSDGLLLVYAVYVLFNELCVFKCFSMLANALLHFVMLFDPFRFLSRACLCLFNACSMFVS